MKPPRCGHCQHEHWSYDPHVYPVRRFTLRDGGATGTVTLVTQAATAVIGAAKVMPTVTVHALSVTPLVTSEVADPIIADSVTGVVTPHECPVCGMLHHRARTGAERQAGYRARQAQVHP